MEKYVKAHVHFKYNAFGCYEAKIEENEKASSWLFTFLYFRLITSKCIYFQCEARCSEHFKYMYIYWFIVLSNSQGQWPHSRDHTPHWFLSTRKIHSTGTRRDGAVAEPKGHHGGGCSPTPCPRTTSSTSPKKGDSEVTRAARICFVRPHKVVYCCWSYKSLKNDQATRLFVVVVVLERKKMAYKQQNAS